MTSPYDGTPNTSALYPLPSSGTYTICYGDNVPEGGRTLISLSVTDFVTLLNLSTSSVSEGSNLYFTNARAVSALSSSLALKADDSAVVHNTGNETISGTKTFSSTISGSITGNAATVTTNANLTGDVTSSGNATTLATVATAGTYQRVTVNAKGLVTSGANPTESTPSAKTIQTVAASANGFQISSTQDALAFYSVKIALSTASMEGAIVLEISPTNSSTAGDWIEKGRVTSGQTVSATLGLVTLTTTNGGSLSAFVPAGYFARLRSINTTGTPTFSYVSGQEVLL